MAEETRNGTGANNNRRRQGSKEPPILSARLVSLTPNGREKDGLFEVPVVVSVHSGERPAYGVEYQILVDAKPVKDFQTVDSEARCLETLYLPGPKHQISIQMRFGKQAKLQSLKEVLLPEKKGSLLLLATQVHETTISISLCRKDASGTPSAGDVIFYDITENGKSSHNIIKFSYGYGIVERPIYKKPRKIIFSLDVLLASGNVVVDIPGTEKPEPKKEEKKPEKTTLTLFKENMEKGREKAREDMRKKEKEERVYDEAQTLRYKAAAWWAWFKNLLPKKKRPPIDDVEHDGEARYQNWKHE